jgi:thiamine biosynthesis lipoprotein
MGIFAIASRKVNLTETAYYSGDHMLYHNHCQAMGTRLDIIFHGVEKPEGDEAFSVVYSRISELEGILSRYDENSPVSMINRVCSRRPMVIDGQLFSILSMCMDYYERTEGLFDVGIGYATRKIREGVKDPGSIREMLENSGMKMVAMEPGKKQIRFHCDRVEVDLGGFGKGYALDYVKSAMPDMGISDAFISFGDSSVLGLGNHPHGKGWKSGISHLFKPGESVFAFDLVNESLSTSGTGTAGKGGKGYGHILHPLSGEVISGPVHASVVSASAAEAEVLSTALLVATEKEKEGLMKEFPACRAIEVAYDEGGNARVRDLVSNI